MTFTSSPTLSAEAKSKILKDFHLFLSENLNPSRFNKEIHDHMVYRCGFCSSGNMERFRELNFGSVARVKLTLNHLILKSPLQADPDWADLNAEIACLVSDLCTDVINAVKNGRIAELEDAKKELDEEIATIKAS